MSGGITIINNWHESRPIFERLRAAGRNPEPLLRMIAAMGASQTRERFVTEQDPDGAKWQPSQRALKKGGKTLTLRGILANSITSNATNQYAEWGTNVVYAAIHNFGGVIKRAARSATLRFREMANGNLMSQADRGASFRNASKLRVFAAASHKRAQEQTVQIGAYEITMPKRTFLGVNEADQSEFMAALADRLQQEVM